MVSSHFPSTLTYAPVYVQPSDNSVINFLQRIVRNVIGRVLKVDVARMICRVPCVRSQFLRSRSKTRTCAVIHCWPEVCPGTFVPVESDSYDADTENQTNFFLLCSTCDVLFLLASHRTYRNNNYTSVFSPFGQPEILVFRSATESDTSFRPHEGACTCIEHAYQKTFFLWSKVVFTFFCA